MERQIAVFLIRLAAGWIRRRPENLRRLTVAAAVEKTADTSQTVCRRQRRSHYIHGSDNISAAEFAQIDHDKNKCKNKAAVKDQAPLIHADYSRRMQAVITPILHYIKYTRAKNAGNHPQHNDIANLISGKFGKFAVDLYKRHPRYKTQRRHHAVPADAQRAYVQKNRFHIYIFIKS